MENRLTVTNEMLSLLGSLQAEPFSAKHDTHSSEEDEPSGSEDLSGKVYEAKRKTSRSPDSEKKRKRIK